MADAKTLIGKRIGNYQIVDQLGKGGMGIVFKAKDLSLGRLAALKFLPDSMASDEDIVKRFVREARSAARLNHPNIVTIYGVARHEGNYYIAMECVEGKPLGELIRKHGKVEVRHAVDIIRQAAEALAEAHTHGIVHRDIKPPNIMITDTGRVKVMDFGLARANYESVQLTSTGTTMGTPHYMPPEQWKDARVDGRSDIYSLGVTMFQLLSGKVPYHASSALAIMRKIFDEPTPVLTDLNSEMPPQVSDIVEKMMAKTPEERYASAEDLVRDLEEYLASHAKPSAAEEAFSSPGTNLTLDRLDKEDNQRREQESSGARPTVIAEQPENATPDQQGPRPARTKKILWLAGADTVLVGPLLAVSLLLVGGGTYTRLFPEDDFVRISEGMFQMGSPPDEADRNVDESLHRVSLTKGFWMSKYEVTQKQWTAVMGYNPSAQLGEDHPVEQVSWEDVQVFIQKINDADDANYRLPTEAEWEYAARAGSLSAYGFGGDPNYLEEYAWYAGNGGNRTHPVATKSPNAWGLYDMSGNVMEWCQDWLAVYDFGSVVDPKGSESGTRRIGRGGSWASSEAKCRSADRSAAPPDNRGADLGFRLCHD